MPVLVKLTVRYNHTNDPQNEMESDVWHNCTEADVIAYYQYREFSQTKNPAIFLDTVKDFVLDCASHLEEMLVNDFLDFLTEQYESGKVAA